MRHRPLRCDLLCTQPLRITEASFSRANNSHCKFMRGKPRRATIPAGLRVVGCTWPDADDNCVSLTQVNRRASLRGLNPAAPYNPKTAKRVLLSSHGAQPLLIGPCPGFIPASSVTNNYSDQTDWRESLYQVLGQSSGQWPSNAYPRPLKALGNRQVARALAIDPADDTTLARQIAEGETP